MYDVLLLILVLYHVLIKNQPGATLAPLSNFFYGQTTKWPPLANVGYHKCGITSLIMVLGSWSWCQNICFQGWGSHLYHLIHHWKHFMTWNCIYDEKWYENWQPDERVRVKCIITSLQLMLKGNFCIKWNVFISCK